MAQLAFVGSSALPGTSGCVGAGASAPRRTRTPRCTTSANSPYAPDPSASKSTLNPYLAARAAERSRAIAEDSAAKAAAWEAELALLRTQSNDTVHEHTSHQSYAQRLSAIYNATTTHSSRVAVQDFVDGQLYAITSNGVAPPPPSPPSIVPEPEPVPTPTPKVQAKKDPAPKVGIESKVSKSVSTLNEAKVLTNSESTESPEPVQLIPNGKASTPAPAPVSAAVSASAAVEVEAPSPIPEPALASAAASAATAPVPAAAPAPTQKKATRPVRKKAAEPEPVRAPTSDSSTSSESGLKAFSTGLIDAIVDGVEAKPVATRRSKKATRAPKSKAAQTPTEPKVIPPNVVDAVNEGKLSSLTVTKLRRMLSECGLKTAGRKSELIARLTSFVRK